MSQTLETLVNAERIIGGLLIYVRLVEGMVYSFMKAGDKYYGLDKKTTKSPRENEISQSAQDQIPVNENPLTVYKREGNVVYLGRVSEYSKERNG